MNAQEAKDRFLRDWYEQMKAADPHHFAEHTGGHDFPTTVCEYTFEQFASSPMAEFAWNVAAAHSAQVEAELSNTKKELANRIHTELDACERARLAEAELVKLQKKLSQILER